MTLLRGSASVNKKQVKACLAILLLSFGRPPERVGCTKVRREAEKGKLVVCSYDRPSNVISQDPLHAHAQ